jgi:protein-disulfide isomerase
LEAFKLRTQDHLNFTKNISKKKRSLAWATGLSLCVISSLFWLGACTDKTATARPQINFKNTSTPNPVVAKIGDEEIQLDDLIGSAGEDRMAYFELQKREYDFKLNRLRALMVEKLIGQEAKKSGTSLEDYINNNVLKGEIKISDAEYQNFVKDKQIPEAQLNEQLKGRIIQFLQDEKRGEIINAHVSRLSRQKGNEVTAYFSRPTMEINIEVGDSIAWGDENAPVTIVEFSDFQCPFCARGADTINKIKKKYGPKKVRTVFKHFPLPMHQQAKVGSAASLCIAEQGKDKFWQFHALLFENQREMESSHLTAHAKKVGANMEKFEECFTSQRHVAAVEADMAQGESLGVRSTPTFFVNGQMVQGAQPLEAFSELIDEELEAAKN